MSDANLQVGIDAGGAVAGSRTVVRSLNDIYSSANTLDTRLRGLESTLGRVGANPGLTQAKAAMQQLQSPLQSIKLELEKIESRIVRIGATALALGAVHIVFGKIREAILGAVKAVDDFQIAVISIAASLTQIRIQNGETDIAGAYEKSSRYAGVLALKLQEVDKNSFANYKGLMAMLQVMTAQGQVLDVNNKKQVEAFTNLSNAIAIMTPGQDQQMQMYQETRALMSGIADRHSQVARMIDQQIKAQGIYKGGLKEVAALGRQHGDTMERLAPYLQGVGAASKDISKTWSTVVATFETALNFIQRAAFGPIVADLTTIVSLFSKLMTSNSGTISDEMQRSWEFIKDAVFDIDEKTKELKFSPEFLNTLKTASQLALAIIDSFAILVKWTIKYSEEIKILIATYIAYKAVLIATTTVDRSILALNETNTAAIVRRDVALAKLGITESSALTIKQANLVIQKEELMMAAQEMAIKTTQNAKRLAEISAINAAAQAKIYDAEISVKGIQIRREDLMLEQTANMEKIKTLGLLREEAVANVALLEGKVALAIAKKQEKVTTIELMLAQQAQLTSQIANGTASKMVMDQLLITETEIAAAKRSSSALSGVVTRTENQLTAARIALTNATNAHNAAVNLGAKTGFQLLALKEAELAADRQLLAARIRAIEVDNAATAAAVRYNAALLAQGQTTGFATTESMAKLQTDFLRIQAQDRLTGSTVAATLVENAHTEALAMNTRVAYANSVANQVLTASTNLLQGALALVGGPIGALIIAIGALTYAWVKLTEAEEVNRSKKIKAIFESDLNSAVRELEEVEKRLAEAEKSNLKKTDPNKAAVTEEQERQNKLLMVETRLKKELVQAETELSNLRIVDESGAVASKKQIRDSEEKVRGLQLQIDKYRQISDRTADVKKKLEELHKEDMKGYAGLGKPLDDDKKAKKSEAEKAFESLIALQDTYQESALRSGKATDELGAKLATLDQQLANDLEQRKEAFKFDPKAAQQAKEYLTVQIEIMKQNAIIADTKKGQEAYDKAVEAASLQQYKSNLDSRKASLQRHLEDKEISQQQYFKFMGDLIIEESSIEMAEQQKVVAAKKAALSETASKGIFSGDFKKAQAELIAAESALDKVRGDSSKRYEDNLRSQIKLLEEQRKATLALESKNAVDEARLASDSYSNSGFSPIKQIDLELAASKAAIQEKYALERDEITSKIAALDDATDSQLALMSTVHQQQMAYIDEENKLRISGITNKDERLTEEKRYADEKTKITTESSEKSSKIQIDSAAQVVKLKTALEKAFALTYEKQKVEEVSEEKKAANSKIAVYTGYAQVGAEALTALAGAQDQTTKKGFENAKAFSLAAAIMNTAAGIANAFTIQPPQLGIAQAALVATTGAIQIATIASTQFGGGAKAPTAPSGSFASGGSSTGGMMGNVTDPLMSLDDMLGYESLIDSNENVAVALGRLSKGLDELTALFSSGGAGMSLATNAPGLLMNATESSEGVLGQITDVVASSLKYILNPLKLGDFVSSIGKALFGGSWQTVGAGIALSVESGVVAAEDYVSSKKSGGLFGSTKRKTTYTENDAVGDYLNELLTPFINDIERMSATLGTTASLDYSSSRTSIATAGKTPEEVASALEDWTLEVLQGMALTVDGLEDLVGSYDDAYAKLKEYNDALVSTNDAFALIGKTLLEGSLATGEFLSVVQRDLFGGMDKFNEAIDTYFTSVFTEAEQDAALLVQAQSELSKTFLLLNRSVPTTRNEFKDLVNSLDITTVSGAQAFAALMDVSEAFGTVFDAAEESLQNMADAAESTLDIATDNLRASFDAEKTRLTTDYNTQLSVLNEQLTATKNTVSTITGYINKLVSARQRMQLQDVTYQQDQYAAAKAMLAATLVSARSGDLSSLDSMDNALDILTSQGADAYANSTDYQRDFFATKTSIEELEMLAGNQKTAAEQAVELAQSQIDVLKTNHDAQIAALDAQLDALLGINESVLELAAAISAFTTAKDLSTALAGQLASGGNASISSAEINAYIDQAMQTYGANDTALMDVYNAAIANDVSSGQLSNATGWTTDVINDWVDARGLKRFAQGTNYVPYDMIAQIHEGERIIPKADNYLLTKGNDELVSEVKALRAELRAAQTEIAKNTLKTAKYIERWDGDGMPEERLVA